MTQEDRFKVTRYVILDSGPAFVGNIGGVGSAREITAVGTCINRLSRIDLITKDPSISKKLGLSAILFSRNTGELIQKLYPALEFKCVPLKELNLKIKDFPEEEFIYTFKLEDQQIAPLNPKPKRIAS